MAIDPETPVTRDAHRISGSVEDALGGAASRLRGRLIVFGIAAVIALTALAVILAWRQYDDGKAQAKKDLRSRAILGATVLDTYFGGAITSLTSIASSPSVTAVDTKRMRAYFARVQPKGGTVFPGGLYWVDLKGFPKASSESVNPQQVSLATRSYVRRVLATDKPFVSEAVITKRLQKRIVVMAVPTHDAQGGLTGVLSGALELRASSTSQRTIDLGFEDMQIIDRAGQQLSGATLERPANTALVRKLRAAKEGVISGDGLDGSSDRVVAFGTSVLPGWKIAIDRPASSVFADARRALIQELLAVAAAAAALLGLIGWGLLRSRRGSQAERVRVSRWARLTQSLGAATEAKDVSEALATAVAEECPHSMVIVALDGEQTGVLELTSLKRGASSTVLHIPPGTAVELGRLGFEAAPSIALTTRARIDEVLPTVSATPRGDLQSIYGERLADRNGRPVGSLTVVFTREAALDESTRGLVRAYADQAAQTLGRARRQEVEHEAAVLLQRSLLPEKLPVIDGLRLAARYRAGARNVEVGGDWYDVIRRSDGILHLTVGDVAGRGIRAAVLMGQLRNAFRAYALDYTSPVDVVRCINRHVGEDQMATTVCVTIDPYTGECSYASAGHPPPVLVDPASGTITHLDGPGSPPLGWSTSRPAGYSAVLSTGSTLALYTDGLIERRDSSIDEGIDFLSATLSAAAADVSGHDVERVADKLVQATIVDPGIEDDATLLLARLTDAPARVEIEIPAQARLLGELRRRLRLWINLRGLEEYRDDAVLAISEACNNAIEHGYRSTQGVIRLTLEHLDSSLRIVIEDEGSWRPPETDHTRGRGLMIMRNLMQIAEVDHTEGGTRVILEQCL